MSKINKSFQNDIPINWSKIPLYELRNKQDRYGFTGGPFGSDLKSEHYTQFGVKILQLQNIGEGKFIDKGIVYTSEEKANELVSCNIYPGEIILAKMAPVARCCKVPSEDERYVMCSDGIRLSVDTNRFDNEFVFQALNSKYFRNEAESKSTGTTRARIGLNELKQICLFVPNSLPEQQKIAEILSTVDAKIEVIDQQITETQTLKKGLMQRLLTKGIGHTEFKDSPLGEIPKSWEVVKIGDVLKLGSGKDYKHLGVGTIPVYGTGGIMTYVDNYLFDGESVGIGRKGTIDKPVLLKDKFWTVDTLFYTHSFNNITPYFVYIVFQSIKWRGYSEATGVPSLSKNIIEPINIPLPTIDEQVKISNIFSIIDSKLEVLSEKKNYYQELKQGLMQQLLTGKVRVNTNENITA